MISSTQSEQELCLKFMVLPRMKRSHFDDSSKSGKVLNSELPKILQELKNVDIINAVELLTK